MTRESRRNLKQIQEFGCLQFLRHMNHEDIAKVCSSLKSNVDNLDIIQTVTSLIGSTNLSTQPKAIEYQINDKKRSKTWQSLPVANPKLKCTKKSLTTNSGKSPNIQSILSSSVPKFKTDEK